MSVELSTSYLGLKLANPLVISACPLTADVDRLRRLEQAGAAAAVLPSLFEEQIEHDAEEMRGRNHEEESCRNQCCRFHGTSLAVRRGRRFPRPHRDRDHARHRPRRLVVARARRRDVAPVVALVHDLHVGEAGLADQAEVLPSQ